MLLTDLMLKVENVEPGAELRCYGSGNWVIENPHKRNPTSVHHPLVLARIRTVVGKDDNTGAVVNKVHDVKIVGNTGPRKQLRVWMFLWGLTLR